MRNTMYLGADLLSVFSGVGSNFDNTLRERVPNFIKTATFILFVDLKPISFGISLGIIFMLFHHKACSFKLMVKFDWEICWEIKASRRVILFENFQFW